MSKNISSMENVVNNEKYDLNKKVVRSKVRICNYCFTADKKQNIIKCCKCKSYMCKKCLTFISNEPYCNNCLIELVRNDSLLIITK